MVSYDVFALFKNVHKLIVHLYNGHDPSKDITGNKSAQCAPFLLRVSMDNSHYRLILKLGKEMQINHHS